MATLYVVQDDGRKNIAPAMQFGKEVVVLASRDLPLFGNPQMRVTAIRSKLKDFDPTQDYLIPTGDPLLIGVAFHAISEIHGSVPCLKWDRQSKQYYPITINLQ